MTMSYHDDSIQALSTLVALLRGPRPTEGRVRIQKLVYLLKAYGLPGLERIRFAYHHYGPYSEQVAGALRNGVASGLIHENTEVFDDEWQKFTYSLEETHTDADYLKLSDAELARVEQLKRATEAYHWRVLELAATAAFLERQAQLSRDQAIERALGHKPACRAYAGDAKALLATLDASLS